MATGGLFRGSVGRVGAAFLSRGWRGSRVVAESTEGGCDNLLFEVEVFRWKLWVAVAGAEVVGVLAVVDSVQRDPLLVAIKTLPAEG